ncbi:hypothetical protein FQN60_010273 [Etheostoma spectabile]|uniref:Uncharacterized protein n=1 Tax=Etheostoma spectabile TaxID=54343 RepID=A0A5J5D2M2_9PERO|nr:hypothetical protein FQN60_010273 [Etheostoma spectabile]
MWRDVALCFTFPVNSGKPKELFRVTVELPT